MAMNGLEGVLACLQHGVGEVEVPEPTRSQALVCIERMLDFVAQHPEAISQLARGFVPHMGSA
jgi:quinolinate synthase